MYDKFMKWNIRSPHMFEKLQIGMLLAVVESSLLSELGTVKTEASYSETIESGPKGSIGTMVLFTNKTETDAVMSPWNVVILYC